MSKRGRETGRFRKQANKLPKRQCHEIYNFFGAKKTRTMAPINSVPRTYSKRFSEICPFPKDIGLNFFSTITVKPFTDIQ